MAHYSYASPDRQSVLVVEMIGAHAFTERCRLIPFDGSSAGRQVGPQGTCTAAAWSPDGEWMYFGATVEAARTSGARSFPTEHRNRSLRPARGGGHCGGAGRPVVGDIGRDAPERDLDSRRGRRAADLVGRLRRGSPPFPGWHTRVLSPCAGLVVIAIGWAASSAELRSVDLASGKTDSVLPGVSVTDYDISPDEKEVAFTTTDGGGASEIWLASLDRRTPPRLIARAGDQVSFAADGHLVFRSLEENTNLLVRIKKDGTGRERITTAPVLDKYGVSPDGEWVLMSSPGAGVDAVPATLAVPIRGGAPRKICAPGCEAGWSSDGKFFYVSLDPSAVATSPGNSWQGARDSRASWQIAAGSARVWNRSGGRAARTSRRTSDRAWFAVDRARPVDIRFHQDRPAAQSVSHSLALKRRLAGVSIGIARRSPSGSCGFAGAAVDSAESSPSSSRW